MNLKVLLTSLLITSAAAPLALAHPDHDHKHEAKRPEIDEQAAKDRAKEEVARLVAKKKVDESWKALDVKTVEKKSRKKSWEWLATFENDAAPKNKILYVFLKPSGEFVAANFTGK